MTRLLVWRHGQTSWNVAGRFQGHTDINLDDTGLRQAGAAAAMLAAERPDAIVSSDLRRAVRTADALTALTGGSVHQDARLRERCFGDWEGLTGAEIADRFPVDHRRWRAGEQPQVNGVEDVTDVGKRVAEALLAAADRAPDGTVVVVTHGGAAKHGCAALLGWPSDIVHTLRGLSNCHWTELRRLRRGWCLYAHNIGPR